MKNRKEEEEEAWCGCHASGNKAENLLTARAAGISMCFLVQKLLL